MKPRKFSLATFFLLALAHPLSAADKKNAVKPKDDFLAGSVVKSDKWEIDRVNNLEIFKGNVSFRNHDYSLKADNAIYNHANKKWDMQDNVYCVRTFDDGTMIEMFCDAAEYSENMQKSSLYSVRNRIRSVYISSSRKVTALSDRIDADNLAGTINFSGEFTVFTDSATIIGDNGLYKNSTGEFEITGKKPFAVGINKEYQTYLEGELINLKKNSQDISVYRDVKGMIIGKNDWPLLRGKNRTER